MNWKKLFDKACAAVDAEEDSLFGGLSKYDKLQAQVQKQFDRFCVLYRSVPIRINLKRRMHCLPHVASLFNPHADQMWCAKCNTIINNYVLELSKYDAKLRRQRKRTRRHNR